MTRDIDFVQYRWVSGTGGDSRYVDPASGARLVLDDSVALDLAGVASARVQPSGNGDTSAVMLTLNAEGAARFGASTALNRERRIAVVVDERVLTIAVIQTAMGTQVPLGTALPRSVADSLARRVNRAAERLRPYYPTTFDRSRNGAPPASRQDTLGTGFVRATDTRVVVRFTSVGAENFTEESRVLFFTSGGGRVGIGTAEPTPLRDTLRVRGVPAFAVDVTDGDVQLRVEGPGRISVGGSGTIGAARTVTMRGRWLLIEKGGAGVQVSD
jgi:hypothetical protein